MLSRLKQSTTAPAAGAEEGRPARPSTAQRPIHEAVVEVLRQNDSVGWEELMLRDGWRGTIYMYGPWEDFAWQLAGFFAARVAAGLSWIARVEAQYGARAALVTAGRVVLVADQQGGMAVTHALRLQALEATFRLMIECEKFEEAERIGKELAQAHDGVYPAVWPVRGLHLASMARLSNFLEDDDQCIDFARRAIDVLAVTHSDSDVLRMTQATLQQSMYSLHSGRMRAATA